MKLTIVKYPHPALRHQSKPLTSIDTEVRRQAEMMLEAMYENRGLGLAANQVAWPFQLLVMNSTGDPAQKEHEHVCINPVILDRGGTMEGEEGCLSFPDLFQKVRRARTVKVQFYNLQGQAVEVACSDLPARVLQHEIDHLNGVLFIDHMGAIARLSARGSVRAFEREFRRLQERGEIPADAKLVDLLREQEQKRQAPQPVA